MRSRSTSSDFDAPALPSKGVSCPGRYLCLVGSMAGVFVSHEPAAADSWSLNPLPSAEIAATAIDCPSLMHVVAT
jgi:hypothetical protein